MFFRLSLVLYSHRYDDDLIAISFIRSSAVLVFAASWQHCRRVTVWNVESIKIKLLVFSAVDRYTVGYDTFLGFISQDQLYIHRIHGYHHGRDVTWFHGMLQHGLLCFHSQRCSHLENSTSRPLAKRIIVYWSISGCRLTKSREHIPDTLFPWRRGRLRQVTYYFLQ